MNDFAEFGIKAMMSNLIKKDADRPDDIPHAGSFQAKASNFHAWARFIDSYSRGLLTKPKDKLVAISALARELKPYMNCRYLAGHWETDLLMQLGWPGDERRTRPRVYRAPSWSWASLDGEHLWFQLMYDSDQASNALVDILSVDIELASDDEMGQVTGGHIDVRGQLIRVDPFDRFEHRSGGRVLVDGLLTNVTFQKDDSQSAIQSPLYCMPLYLILNDKPIFKGLGLQAAAVPGEYQRVGSMECRFHDDRLERNDAILDLLGSIEWDDMGEHRFTRDTSSLQRFKIM